MRECDGVDIEIVLVLLFFVIKYYVPVKNKYKYIFDIKYFFRGETNNKPRHRQNSIYDLR